ncbi:hypothetical protein F5I97DRAFT_1419472 [Phlebopus sp. FC_14]|nr:hypothetical protein F5I97DRAFT_1419472 [Phlebopus sp. FC_14]
MAYVNPGNLMLNPSGPGTSQHYARVANPPVHPGAMHAPMPDHYTLRDHRRIERVPRSPHYIPPYESIPAVTFSIGGWPGARLRDVLKLNVLVDNPYDTPFVDQGWRTTVVCLEWPGYEQVTFTDRQRTRINTVVQGRPVTRQEIAKEVCGLLFHFHTFAKRYSCLPGWEKWALTDDNIVAFDVVLLSMHYYRNVWIPEFYVIE